jgi:hypothetical protein
MGIRSASDSPPNAERRCASDRARLARDRAVDKRRLTVIGMSLALSAPPAIPTSMVPSRID